jgi:hypothetical protein
MALTSIAFKLAVSGTFISWGLIFVGTLIRHDSDWYALITCAIIGFTLMSWIALVLISNWS